MYRCVYFGIKELVSPLVYKRWGEQAWMFFPEELLKELDYLRESYGHQIIINNWAAGGNLTQCGLRCNLDPMVMEKSQQRKMYLSAHVLGRAFDLHCGIGQNKKLWQHAYKLLAANKLKHFRRIESEETTKSNWVHLDGMNTDVIVFK